MSGPGTKMSRLILGDCLEILPKIPSGSIDMVLADLPYGMTQNKWDSAIDLDLLWPLLLDVGKETCAFVFTAAQPFTSALGWSNLRMLRYSWVWRKNNATGHLNAKRMPMKDCEDVLVFYAKRPTYNPQGLKRFEKLTRRGGSGSNYGRAGTENFQEFTGYPRTLLEVAYDRSKLHPTQKPVELFEYLVRTYTNRGDIVLDPCVGSGTTALACERSGRGSVGIEISDNYLKVAEGRLAALES